MARTQKATLAYCQYRNTGDTFTLSQGKDVRIATFCIHELALLELTQMLNLIAQAGGILEGQAATGGFHGLGQLRRNLFATPCQAHHGVFQVTAVGCLTDISYTRCTAALDLVLQARPGAMGEDAILAVADTKDFLHQ